MVGGMLLPTGAALLLILAVSVQETASQDLFRPNDTFDLKHHLSVTSANHEQQQQHSGGIHVASWRWDEIGVFFTFTAFVLITGLAKVAFHHVHFLSSRIPESCLMIIMGVAVGGVLYAAGVQGPEAAAMATDKILDDHPKVNPTPMHESSSVNQQPFIMPMFTPRLFFLVLLPPVILESAYSLYDRAFADNLTTILLYAVVGTLFNTFAIGALLFGIYKMGIMGSLRDFGGFATSSYSLTLLDSLVFSALISAVDPVAVLAIFQEVGVNKDLYFLVFGESLLNDAVTVVLYTTMVAFTEMTTIHGEQYALAILSFFTVSCGGLFVGIIGGLLTALITKTTQDVRVVEPLAVLGMAYLSYLSAELFHFSGIISIIGCGLVQAHYAFKNISHKSYTTVKYFTKMLSSTSDAIIFLFLGMVLVSDKHVWHTGFVLWTLLLCLICRFVGVFLLTALNNLMSVRQIEMQEQFIMAYGGLRGAVGFSLVVMLDGALVPPRQLFITATLVVILFTVFIQGSTIKTLVDFLHIERSQAGHKTLHEEVSDHVISMLMAGIEEIAGARGDYYIRRKLEYLDDKYLKRIFMNPDAENDLTRMFEKLTLTEHFAHLYGPVTLVEDQNYYGGYDSRESLDPHKAALMGLPPPGSYFRVSDLFPGVELRRRGTMVMSPSSSAPPTRGRSRTLTEGELTSSNLTLRKALRNTPYQRFHYKHNRNLIDDDYQELRNHLERRLLTARRITHMAALRHHSAQSVLPTSSVGPSSLETQHDIEFFDQPRRQVVSGEFVEKQHFLTVKELQGVYPEDLPGMQAIFTRTNRRLSIARQRSSEVPSEVMMRSMSDEQAPGPQTLHVLQRQPRVSDSPSIAETNEMEEHRLLNHPNVPQRNLRPGSSESEV
ncbi:sodium/hydrogen exchanger 2-like isoform X2 [Neocloeon triangulifer]|uniref:sodium/hydrogen exchanger 2-like isoform X2 n=1 Tax=Neocloeon triangulifer TaxID=2078957 RepID=UPI00286EBBAB|nr:sodium/hydrogen exchanger 2-like isoform X2 [Neocloeon triangulifer]